MRDKRKEIPTRENTVLLIRQRVELSCDRDPHQPKCTAFVLNVISSITIIFLLDLYANLKYILNDYDYSQNVFRDGSNQQLGGCMRDFRNRPHPIRAKVRYYNKVLTVSLD